MHVISPGAASLPGPFNGLELLLLGLVVVLGFMIWRLTRHDECHYTGEPDARIDDALRAVAGSTHGHVTEGNTVSLIQNETFFEAIIAAIGEAKRSVHLETFLWQEGEASNRIGRALASAARRGVTVRVQVDAGGGFRLKKSTIKHLRKAGCNFRQFHRWRVMNFGHLNIRDHRKILVIDGSLAFVGGHCISDDWLIGKQPLGRYRDITARISGPVVASIQSCFLENWTEITEELFTDDATFPRLHTTGSTRAHVAYVSADRCPSAVQVLHHLAIGYAKTRIRIQNPYFLPDPSSVEALVKAVQRGVDVRVMIPALGATDSPYISRAGRFQYQRLLEGGVRILEYQKTLLHQKIIAVDGRWCGIGSSNFDDRSFEINDEITVGFADERLVGELEQAFENDATHCQELSLEAWRARPWRERAADAALYLFNEQF